MVRLSRAVVSRFGIAIAGIGCLYIPAARLQGAQPQAVPAQTQTARPVSTTVSPHRTLLNQYCVSCHNEKLRLGAATDSTNSAGDTALHVAASGQLTTIVQLLAERGARLEVKNKRGQTPLALASASGRRGGARAGGPLSTGELLRKLGAKE